MAEKITALIEVKVSPKGEGGFNKIADKKRRQVKFSLASRYFLPKRPIQESLIRFSEKIEYFRLLLTQPTEQRERPWQ